MFHPKALPYSYTYHFKDSFNEINLEINKNEMLNMVRFYPRGSSKKGIVVYFHGNMENVNHYAADVQHFIRNGYEVLMPDYPGFGKSTGALTEKNLYSTAELAYKFARSKYHPDSLIIYGRSLGTGIASYLASRIDCKRLMLETPYSSIPSLFSTYLPVYPLKAMSHFKLPTEEYLTEVSAPVTIFHGTKDNLIPYTNAIRLKQSLKTADQFITIENGGHNNLSSFPQFNHILDSLLQL